MVLRFCRSSTSKSVINLHLEHHKCITRLLRSELTTTLRNRLVNTTGRIDSPYTFVKRRSIVDCENHKKTTANNNMTVLHNRNSTSGSSIETNGPNNVLLVQSNVVDTIVTTTSNNNKVELTQSHTGRKLSSLLKLQFSNSLSSASSNALQKQQAENGTTESSTSSPEPQVYRNNASAIFPFHVNVRNPDHLLYVAIQLCAELRHSSNKLGPNSENSIDGEAFISVRPLIAGGLSNELFLVENTTTQYKVLIRIHPERDHDETTSVTANFDIVDRDVENQLVAWLSETGDAPLYFGRFINGRVEEFYDNHVPLSHQTMVQHTVGIAQLMASIHNKHPPSYIQSLLSPKSSVNKDTTTTIAGSIWDRGDLWLSMAKADLKSFQNTHQQQSRLQERKKDKLTFLQSFLHEIEGEWNWLKANLLSRIMEGNTNLGHRKKTVETIDTIDIARIFCAEVVLSHMDCQSLNILKPESDSVRCIHDDDDGSINSSSHNNSTPVDFSDDGSSSVCDDNDSTTDSIDTNYETTISQETIIVPEISDNINNRLRLIDYEYAGMNPRGADIANTFCEYCDMNNLKANYHTEYPSDTVQNDFFKSYMDVMVSKSIDYANDGSIHEHLIKFWLNVTPSQQDEFFRALRHEIGQYTLISHLTWSIWSIVRSVTAEQEDGHDEGSFDYIAYAKQRMDGYYYFQKKFFRIE